jgi:hypothetical protein
MIRRLAALFAAILVLLVSPLAVTGAPIIELDNYVLQQNQAGQVISIYVRGDVDVAGLNFYIQIGDGILSPGFDPAVDGPSFTNLDVIGTGTIFSSSNTGQYGSGAMNDQFADATVSTVSGTTVKTGNGSGGLALLARVTISTVGVSAGEWALKLKGLKFSPDTNFVVEGGSGIAADIVNGSISIVPEPAAYVNLLLLPIAGAVPWMLGRRRKSRARRARSNGVCRRAPV